MFKNTDPAAFARAMLNSAAIQRTQAKQESKQAERAKMQAIQAAEKAKRGSLFSVNCGNPNCLQFVEYVYENTRSERRAVHEAGWITFPGDLLLCPHCAGIQRVRDLQEKEWKRRQANRQQTQRQREAEARRKRFA